MMNTHVRDEARAGIACIYNNQLLSDTASAIDTSTLPTITNLTSLLIVAYARSTTAVTSENMWIRLNGDTSGNYDYQSIQGNGATASAAEALASSNGIFFGNVAGASATANSFSAHWLLIPWAKGSANHKVAQGGCFCKEGTSTGNLRTYTLGGAWRSTSAITSVQFRVAANNFKSDSVFSVFAMGR